MFAVCLQFAGCRLFFVPFLPGFQERSAWGTLLCTSFWRCMWPSLPQLTLGLGSSCWVEDFKKVLLNCKHQHRGFNMFQQDFRFLNDPLLNKRSSRSIETTRSPSISLSLSRRCQLVSVNTTVQQSPPLKLRSYSVSSAIECYHSSDKGLTCGEKGNILIDQTSR